MAAFSLDLRQRVLADCQAGLTYAAIARKYTVSAEWVRTFYNRFRETGEVAARSHATKRRPYHPATRPNSGPPSPTSPTAPSNSSASTSAGR